MGDNAVTIDRTARESLQGQVRRRMAIAIVDGRYALHSPLPSIRRLAGDLGVSSKTVALAYEGLKRDGFIWSRVRSGFFPNHRVVLGPKPGFDARPQDAAVPPPPRISVASSFPSVTAMSQKSSLMKTPLPVP